jgi:hypothetical protein
MDQTLKKPTHRKGLWTNNDSNLCAQGTAKHYYALYNALAESK